MSPAGGAQAARTLFGNRSTLSLGLALYVTLALLRSVVVMGIGDQMAPSQPQAALKFGRDSPEVLASVALEAWQARANRLTTKYALAALDRSPLNVLAMRMEALGLESQGKPLQAERLMQFAGTRSWRDDGVHLWLLHDCISKGDFDCAYRQADALARRRADFWPMLFLLLDGAVAGDASSRSLVERLAARPNWRAPFLESLALSRQKDPAIERLFHLIDQSPAPLTGVELSVYPTRLAGEGHFRDAFAVLQGYRYGRALTGSPFDGGFTDQPGVAPFAWVKLAKPGASLDMDPAPDRPSSNGLRVEYDGYSATDLMRQALAPQPGDYLLTGEIRPQDGDPAVLSWQARCAADGKILATTPSSPKTPPNAWTRFAVPFTVPAQGCDGVWLVLTETPQNHRSSNVTWYANLAVRAARAPGATK